jgi:hypothetical protein
MQLSRSQKAVVLVGALGAGVLGVAVQSWAAPAATRSSVIHGCYNKTSGAVRVLTASAGGCGSRETAIHWNVAGPAGPAGARGPQGLRGPKGDTGAAGSGTGAAVPTKLALDRNSTGTATVKTVGNYTYTPTCKVTGSKASIVVTTGVVINQTGGQVYNVYGPVQSQSNDKGPITTVTDSFHDRTGASGFSTDVDAGLLNRFYFTLTIVGSDGSYQELTMRLSANGKATVPAHEARCMVEGLVVPAVN